MCNYRDKNNNVPLKNPDRHYINQMIKGDISSNAYVSDGPQCNPHHLSSSSSSNTETHSIRRNHQTQIMEQSMK